MWKIDLVGSKMSLRQNIRSDLECENNPTSPCDGHCRRSESKISNAGVDAASCALCHLEWDTASRAASFGKCMETLTLEPQKRT